MLGDGGAWLMEQCMTLAKNNNGSPFDWLALPLRELRDWIGANNRAIEKRENKR